ncbi:ArsR/SmtB family transcription factor [Streptomyces sp. NPDC003374]
MASQPPLDDDLKVFLKVLASQARQRIMQYFSDGAELTVGEVAELTGLRYSTASEHLSLLQRGGLLHATRDGKIVRYRADRARIMEQLARLQLSLVG